MTVDDLSQRLHRLEAVNVEAGGERLAIEKMKDAKTLHDFLDKVRGKEKEYVSRSTYHACKSVKMKHERVI